MKFASPVLAILLLSGCGTLSGFLSDIGSAAQGTEIGGVGSDTTAEKIIDVVEVVHPTLPPVAGYIVSAVLSGLAVYSHLTKKPIKPEKGFIKKGYSDETTN